jgi:hypothetical protein
MFGRRQSGGGAIRRQQVQWMRLEGHRDGRDARLAGGRDERRQHLLMAAMHAVEITDRQARLPVA